MPNIQSTSQPRTMPLTTGEFFDSNLTGDHGVRFFFTLIQLNTFDPIGSRTFHWSLFINLYLKLKQNNDQMQILFSFPHRRHYTPI